ncbi:MAG: hypothetical protein QGG36_24920 [Pirellulaceae bacterium]|jgi:hypothetical protein|nr:hypothetical protein [Pirellulaceae bacterium]MDP7019063.1 hypothetical protein [Pirellulaceae bacterium]
MSSPRRIIRKLRPAGEPAFDEQFWPVQLALILLGAFLAGVSLAYLKFDAPSFWQSAWTALAVIAVFVAASMVVLRYVSNRRIRRGMQLAFILCLIFHVIVLVTAHRAAIFGRLTADRIVTDRVDREQQEVILEEYHPAQMNREEDERLDFELPVETESPDPEPQEIEREQPRQAPVDPQNTPTVEQPQQAQANVVKRTEPEPTTPRMSETQSQLSRSTPRQSIAPATLVEVAETKSRPAESAAPAATQVARTEPQKSAAARSQAEPDPTAAASEATSRRATAEADPTADSPSSAAIARTNRTPALTPQAQVNVQTRTAAARQATAEPTPQTLAATKQPTASPLNEATRREPNVDPSVPDVTTERRRVESQPAATVARTADPVRNRQPRMTKRPNTSVLAQLITPSPTSESPAATPRSQPTTPTRVARSQSTASRRETAEPTPSREPSPTAVTRATSQVTPTETPDVSTPTSLRRRVASMSPAPNVPTEATTPTAVARTANDGDVSPSSTALTKRQTAIDYTAETASQQQSQAVQSQTQVAAQATGARREMNDAPPVDAETETQRRADVRATLAVASAPAPDARSSSAPNVSESSELRASSAAVARQASPSAAARSSSQPQAVESASEQALAARSATRRSASNAQPSLSPQADLAQSPARSMRAAPISSPAVAESPSEQSTSTAQSPAPVRPSRTALARGDAGVAGSGRTANLDRQAPAPDNPSLVASASARRRQTTQNSPTGPALTPEAASPVRQSRASMSPSSTTFKAQAVAVADTAGGQSAGELQASSSASVNEAMSNAERAEMTAASGTVEVDAGPTRVVSEAGSGRSGGGGQPELSDAEPVAAVARRTGGGAMSIAANVEAPAPAAPTSTGGGATLANMSPQATSVVRTESGGQAPTTGGPTSATESGPPEVAARHPKSGAPAVARATKSDEMSEPAVAAGPQGDPTNRTSDAASPRVARRNRGGAPTTALAGPVAPNVAAPAATGEATAPTTMEASPAAGSVARTETRAAPTMSDAAAARSAGAAEPEGQLAARTGDALPTRAEMTDGVMATPAVGGGTTQVSRASRGPAIAASTQAETVELSGAPQSGGAEDGSPLAAQMAAVGKTAGGAPEMATTAANAAGGVEGQGGSVATSAARRSISDAGGQPDVAAAAGTRLARAARGTRGAAVGSVELPNMTDPAVVGAGGSGRADGPDLQAGSVGSIQRAAQGVLVVAASAPDGAGGLGGPVASDAGIVSRRASRDSVQVAMNESRFRRNQSGGAPSISTAVIFSAEPFRGRDRSGLAKAVGPETEQAIEGGLAYLARRQQEDGRWSLQGHGDDALMVSDAAATGLALLAFQGAGYHHQSFRYKTQCSAAINFLLANQKDDGDLYIRQDEYSNGAAWFYTHGIAALALTEAYGMTKDPALRDPAQRAVDFIVKTQNKNTGGWRYAPQVSSDTSVTGWMLMAMKSGQMAGLSVPQQSLDRVDYWLDRSGSGEFKEKYRYNPDAPDTKAQGHGRRATTAMTAVGLLMRLYNSDWKTDSVGMRRGADALMKELPALGGPRNPKRDTYYWYYATQVMFHMKGEYWQAWNGRLRPLLLNTQIQDGANAGSWDPLGGVPDRWGPHAGRIYVTAMNLLSLEVRFRHMPINRLAEAESP